MKKNKSVTQKFLTVLLASAMVLTMMPLMSAQAFATDDSSILDNYSTSGYIPMPRTYETDEGTMVKDFGSAKDETSGRRSSGSDEVLPAAYRSDEQPWAEGLRVKDQFRTSLCWAFAMTSAAEYSYAKEVYENTGEIGVVKELSPGHLGQFHYNRVNDPLGNTYGDSNDVPVNGSWPLYGGNDIFAMQQAATWSGLAAEEKYPIKKINDHIIKDKNYSDVWDGHDIVYPASGAYDNELLQQETIVMFHPVKKKMKELIYKYGAITGSMEFDYRKYMNLDEVDENGDEYLGGRSYYNYNDTFSANHALTLVGWDDNYPKENFSHVIQEEVDMAEAMARETAEAEARARAEAEAEQIYRRTVIGKETLIRNYVDSHLNEYIEEIVAAAVDKAKEDSLKKTTPDKNGAWIVQNSWSDVVHDKGFFYASYEDIDFNTEIADLYAYDMMPVDTYKYNFQYDGNALSTDASDRDSAGFHFDYYTKPGSRAANIYTNTTGEPVNIEAVGYTTFTNGDQAYDVSVYTGLTDPTDPTSGKLQGTTRVTTSTRGCKTAVLDDPVYVAPGKTYSIVFDFTDFSAFGVETEASSPYFLFEADTDPGQSFFSRSKSSKWVDMNDYEACFRIKGFANPTELIPEEKGPDQSTVKPSQTDGKASPESDTTKTQKAQKLPAVKISSLAAATGSAKLQWNKLSSADAKNVTGIEIQYSTSKSFKKGVKTVTAKATAKSKKIKKLKSNKKYYVRMRTYKKANGKKTTSKWSKVKSVKVK